MKSLHENSSGTTITALVLSNNSARTISACLNSLKSVHTISEIIVVDDNSTDQTVSLVKKTHAKLLHRSLNDNFAGQKNFGLTHAHTNWVFIMDSDETLSSPLTTFLNSFTANTYEHYGAIAFKREDYFLGKFLHFGENHTNYFPRLVQKTKGRFVLPVHEEWCCNLPTLKRPETILHKPHPNLTAFLTKINRYSDIRASFLATSNHRPPLIQVLMYPILKFVQNYVLRMGFRDGLPGLIMALGMSFHSFLTYGKLYCLVNTKK